MNATPSTFDLAPPPTSGGSTTDAARFGEAMAWANVPTLLMLLVQLTGELRWLEHPYLPRRARGLSDNETGGLPESVQSEVRSAALAAILAWRAGTPVAIPKPSTELLITMLSVAMGEEVPAEYAPMIGSELDVADIQARRLGSSAAHKGSHDESHVESHDESQDAAGGPLLATSAENALNGIALNPPAGFKVLIIGGGISGICAAISLQQAGIDYTIIERQSDIGGVWLANTYPGAAVDTPSHLYSFSFAPHDWARYFESQANILAYLNKVADDFAIRSNVRFNTSVISSIYNETTQCWTLAVEGPSGAEALSANVVISAVGAYNKPKIPRVEGTETFGGPNFHTANWPTDIDLTGKRVAVIGNGASAMQVVPAIVDKVASMVVFQHSPQWVGEFEKFQQNVPEAVRFLIAEVPLYYAWYRARLAWIFNDRLYTSLQKDPEWPHPERSLNAINEAHRIGLTKYIESELGDRVDLRDKVVPTYPPFGKRMLLDNGWFKAIAKPQVTVETERVIELRPGAVVSAAGTAYDVDVVVWATGFDVVRFLVPIEIRGRGGVSLHDVWDGDDARAYLGTAIPQFPNFFVLYGPNTQFGHGGSLITLMERQVHYLMTMLQQMFANDLGSVEVRADTHDAYNARIDEAHEHMVWTHPGMDTYYRNARGRVVVNNPLRMCEFWSLTEAADLNDYLVSPLSPYAI